MGGDMSLERLKMIFGFSLLVIIAALAGIIAIGHVQQATSYGLEFLLGALSAMAGGFVQWAFGSNTIKEKSNDVS